MFSNITEVKNGRSIFEIYEAMIVVLELKQILHILVSKKNWRKRNLKYCKNVGNGKITNIDLGLGKILKYGCDLLIESCTTCLMDIVCIYAWWFGEIEMWIQKQKRIKLLSVPGKISGRVLIKRA